MMGGELVVGLFIQAVIGLAWWGVKACIRAVRCCVIEHPVLTALLFVVAWDRGLIADWAPWLMPWVVWYPPVITGLLVLGVVRWATPDHVREARRFYRGQVRSREQWARDQVKDWRDERKRIRNLPPPPDPPPPPIQALEPPAIPMGTAGTDAGPAGRDVLDVKEARVEAPTAEVAPEQGSRLRLVEEVSP
jgi:hypothetical protein